MHLLKIQFIYLHSIIIIIEIFIRRRGKLFAQRGVKIGETCSVQGFLRMVYKQNKQRLVINFVECIEMFVYKSLYVEWILYIDQFK